MIVFSDGEARQSEMRQELPPSSSLEYFLGNVRDFYRVREAMQAGVDCVIHAAALKEVPVAEYDWPEAVATNVDGSRNVALAAKECGVAKALLISTDKAVDAVTEYGKTKAMAESWFVRMNRGYRDSFDEQVGALIGLPADRRKGHHTMFGVVRYGNVLASRGSIVPAVKARLAANDLVALTDLRMTRFWWTLDQAVSFVHDVVLAQMGPGQIWVPKLPAAPLVSLVQAIHGGDGVGTEVKVVGIRGKEKLHEVLIAADEARHAYDVHRAGAYVVMPADASWPSTPPPRAALVPPGFSYRSDDESRWLPTGALTQLVEASLADCH